MNNELNIDSDFIDNDILTDSIRLKCPICKKEDLQDKIVSDPKNAVMAVVPHGECSKGGFGEIHYYDSNGKEVGIEECGTCGGEDVIDSGGVTPWGAGIDIPCPECNKS